MNPREISADDSLDNHWPLHVGAPARPKAYYDGAVTVCGRRRAADHGNDLDRDAVLDHRHAAGLTCGEKIRGRRSRGPGLPKRPVPAPSPPPACRSAPARFGTINVSWLPGAAIARRAAAPGKCGGCDPGASRCSAAAPLYPGTSAVRGIPDALAMWSTRQLMTHRRHSLGRRVARRRSHNYLASWPTR